jgi:hypothetical protein
MSTGGVSFHLAGGDSTRLRLEIGAGLKSTGDFRMRPKQQDQSDDGVTAPRDIRPTTMHDRPEHSATGDWRTIEIYRWFADSAANSRMRLMTA